MTKTETTTETAVRNAVTQMFAEATPEFMVRFVANVQAHGADAVADDMAQMVMDAMARRAAS